MKRECEDYDDFVLDENSLNEIDKISENFFQAQPKKPRPTKKYDSIEIYTDGSCLKNPGPGGWGALIIFKSKGKVVEEETLQGGDPQTTNNRMEVLSSISAIQYILDKNLEETENIEITTDSKYLKDGITSWISNWKKNGWKTSQRKPVLNQDLWMKLDSLIAMVKVKWNWTKGHNGHIYNERVDKIANAEAQKFKLAFNL